MSEIIVINRAAAGDRLAFMTEQLGRFGLDFLRLDAVTPETVPAMPDGYWTTGTRTLSANEQALLASHRQAWEWVAKNGHALILQDTAVIARRVADIVGNIEGTDLIEHLSLEVRGRRKLLGRTSIPIANNVAAYRMYLDRAGAAAYMLSPTGAEKLLARSAKRADPVDLLIAGTPGLRSFQSVPAQAVQADMAQFYGIDPPASVTDDPADGPRRRGTLGQLLRRSVGPMAVMWRRLRHAGVAKRRHIPVLPEAFD